MPKNIDKQKHVRIAGSMLKGAREMRGLSQQEVAELIGISKATVDKIENGEWNFSIYLFFRYAEELGFYVFLKQKEKVTAQFLGLEKLDILKTPPEI